MSDFIHEPVPQVVVVQDPNTGETKATPVVNSDMMHVTPEQTSDMASLKAEQANERAKLILEHHEENHTNEEGEITLGEAFIQARDEGDGHIVIPSPPTRITTRPPTQEELDAVVPYRASTPDSDKAAVQDLKDKKLITEERQHQWNAEIDKIAKDVPGEDTSSLGVSVAAKDSNVSPPPYSQINDKDFSEAKTEDASSTPQTTPRDTNERTQTVDPEIVVDPRAKEIVSNRPTPGVNATTDRETVPTSLQGSPMVKDDDIDKEVPAPQSGFTSPARTSGQDEREDAARANEETRNETPVLKLGE